MNRKDFIKASIGLPLLSMNLQEFEKEVIGDHFAEAMMPLLFVGHGSPMNAIEDNAFSRSWAKLGNELSVPKAILCVSAHWQTRGTKVTAMEQPKTIHDFGGFPKALFDVQYPAPGSPQYAQLTMSQFRAGHISKDFEWGLDHGTWSVLKPMFPKANIPTFQLSLDYTATPQQHVEIAKHLMNMRKKGVLIIGSGNIVHNLGLLNFEGKPFDWATEFDELAKTKILNNDLKTLTDYKNLGKAASLSIPTNEHYLPLLYILALKQKQENTSFFNESIEMGSVSMRSLKIS
ncbi:MAG: 4,5-DOPA dioxygenase extradiol [Bacteroidota bacterium]|nr:4,5-DOPA dioxygenase extradiol [Bacteroidota bacterium]